jgi:hypothetical protein
LMAGAKFFSIVFSGVGAFSRRGLLFRRSVFVSCGR